MARTLFALGVVLCASAAVAQAGDALESSECRQALESLQAKEAAVAAARQAGGRSDGRGPRAPDPEWQKLRQHAARTCLGGRADSPPPAQRFTQPPIVVPPIGAARPARPPAPPTGPIGPLPPPQPIQSQTIVFGCDAVGCWANDGSRLIRVGPNLLGPRGLCSVQGTLLLCP